MPSPTSDFLPFAQEDTYVESQVDYADDPQLLTGNIPGIANLLLVNKALRQGTWVASQLALWLVNRTGTSLYDNQNSAEIQAVLNAAFQVSPTISIATVSSFSGNFSAAGSGTYTVPPNIGYLRIKMVGGGGGGEASNGDGGRSPGGAGGDTTFGTSFLFAGGAPGANAGSTGGTASITGPNASPLIVLSGGTGSGSQEYHRSSGGGGASSPFGGAGGGGGLGSSTYGYNAVANTGSGGGGGACFGNNDGDVGGFGGGAGGYIEVILSTADILALGSSFSYNIGAGGTGGSANGGTGGSGIIIIEEVYS